jgi:hypothetical protein
MTVVRPKLRTEQDAIIAMKREDNSVQHRGSSTPLMLLPRKHFAHQRFITV